MGPLSDVFVCKTRRCAKTAESAYRILLYVRIQNPFPIPMIISPVAAERGA